MFRVLNQLLLKGVYSCVLIGSVLTFAMSINFFLSVFSADNIGEGSLLVAASLLLFVLGFCMLVLFFHCYLAISYSEKITGLEMTKEKEFDTGVMKSLFERESLLFNIEKQEESFSETNMTYSLLDDNGNELKAETIKIEKNVFFEMKSLKKEDFEKIRKIRIKDDEGLSYKVSIHFISFNGK